MIPARGPQTKLKGNHDCQAICSWARQVYASLGKWATPVILGFRLLAARLGKSRHVSASLGKWAAPGLLGFRLLADRLGKSLQV